MKKALKNTAAIACLTFIFSSCSGVRYGYISRIKDKNMEKTVAVVQNENTAAEEQNIEPAEAATLGFTASNDEAPVITNQETRSIKACKTHNSTRSEQLSVKKVKPLAMLKEMKKANSTVKTKPDSGNDIQEISGYFRTGLILVLIGAILLFFPSPVSIIGYIIMLVGVVFVVLGLIDML